MVKDGWLHEGRRTDSRRKRTTDRTKNDNLSLSNCVGEIYKVKPGSDKEPDIYLGANVKKVQMPDGREVWASSPRDYVKNAIKTVERLFDEDGEG
jgi:hypothetical protein